ncbi:hypothetical protein F5X96DRAFT_180254 [Biscogniauxia mediterranea]|nr:hypothetical protein F5X96DRAFT_180254 [Biscogniauxia mediterranea]
MRFPTTTALLVAAWGLGLAAAAPNPSPSQAAASATGNNADDDSDVWHKTYIRLPASVTGQLELDTQGVLDYAEKKGIVLPEMVKLGLELAPKKLLVIDGGEADCAAPLELPADSGLKGKLCGPDGFRFDLLQLLLPAQGSSGSGNGGKTTPAVSTKRAAAQCDLGCYHDCLVHIGQDNIPQYDTCLGGCIKDCVAQARQN